MTPQEVSVFNRKRGKLFRDGVEPVYVLEDGRFVVKRDNDWVAFNTLATLDKTKPKRNDDPPVKVMRLLYGGEGEVREIIAWQKDKVVFSDGTVAKYNTGGWRLYDQSRLTEYVKLMKWKAKLEQEICDKEVAFDDTLGETLDAESFRAAQLELIQKGKKS